MRLSNGLTQLNVADRLGVTPQAVSKWERYESMPDITLLPELAKIYGVTVEDIITAGEAGQDNDISDIMRALNTFMDERVFDKVLCEFKKAKSICELRIPLDILMAMNARQKDILLELILAMDGYALVTDDIIQYLNTAQRAKFIMRAANDGDYETLETLIPFMSRNVRTDVVRLLLERGQYDFLEEMLLFLNHGQREMVVRYFIDNGLDSDVLENLLPLLARRGADVIQK